jgi:hypothetical protein
MAATSEALVHVTLRNIDVGSPIEKERPDPSPSDPGRRSTQTSRLYRLTFSTERPGMSATFVVDVGWDGRPGETNCPVEDLELVGKDLVRKFASAIVHST